MMKVTGIAKKQCVVGSHSNFTIVCEMYTNLHACTHILAHMRMHTRTHTRASIELNRASK